MKQKSARLIVVRRLLSGGGLLLALLAGRPAAAQTGPTYFQPDAQAVQRLASPQLQQYRGYTLDLTGLRQYLAGAGRRGSANSRVLQVPQPDGSSQRFRVWEAPLLSPALAAKNPTVHTYGGQGLDDPSAQLSLTVSHTGLQAQILTERPSGAVYLEAVSKDDAQHIISYYAKDVLPATGSPGACGTTTLPAVPQPPPARPHGPSAAAAKANAITQPIGPTLTVYRLIVTTTKEYSASVHSSANGTDSTDVLTNVAALINNVRTIQERDLAVSMTLVNYKFYNSLLTGNYDQTNDLQMIQQNRINVESRFGVGAFDLGHLFASSGSGLAYVGSVANPNLTSPYSTSTLPVTGPNRTYKAGAVSGNGGRSSPISYFSTSVIAHEMGHQFGAAHTFNGGCAANRSAATAWEPGSGSTIMSYADVGCGTSIETRSDPYYHAGSIDQMRSYVEAITANYSAGTAFSTGNSAPTITVSGNKTIPQGTPFKLTATGADADAADVLRYNWDELDTGSLADVTATQTTNDNFPLFRSILPTTTGATRYFPRLSYLGNSPTASTNASERLPTVGRTLSFKCTVRDYHAGTGTAYNATASGIVGGVAESSLVALTVSAANAQPFAVTAPNTAVKWAANSTQTVSWNGVGTKSSAVNCQTVNIRLSTDGGLTYPTVLLSGAPNADGTGAASITVPAGINTTTARIMVEAADNYFFDISDTNFTITDGPVALSLTPTSGPVGTAVTIVGDNFGTSAANLSVTFAGLTGPVAGTITSVSNTSLQVTVPDAALTGAVVVTRTGTGAGSDSPGIFTVTPVVSSINPTAGAEGSAVTITGTGLGGARQVSFNGAIIKAANFTSTNFTSQPNTITLNVPIGATTGPVVATTAGGPSNNTVVFTVTTFTFSPLAISPAANTAAASEAANVVATLNAAPDASAVAAQPVKVSSLQAGGRRPGTTTSSGNTIVFDPATDFRAGEVVQVSLPAAAVTTGGSMPLARAYVSQYTVRTRPTTGLQASTNYTAGVGTRPEHVVAGNLNADAALDLVVVNQTSNTVSVLLNNGTGTSFTAASGSPITLAGLTPSHVVLADLNNDGNLDMLVTCTGSSGSGATVDVLQGNGDGTFSLVLPQPLQAIGSAQMVAVGDLNGDGNLDIVAPRYTNPGSVAIGLGNGSFGFTTTTYSGVGVGPRIAVLVDMNEDGQLDLVTGNNFGGTVSIRLGSGTGTFSGGTDLASSGLNYLATADFNGDGHADLVANNTYDTANGSPLLAWLGNGDGTVGAASTLLPGVFGYTVSTGDYNGDGTVDIIVPRSGSGSGGVNIFSYVAGSGFRTTTAFSGLATKTGIGVQPRYVALADLNNDQALDIFTANSTGANSVSVALGTTSGAPLPVTLLSLAATRQGTAAVQLAWRTASELHNAGFVVERSLDGRTFAAVSGLLPGLGSSPLGRAYHYLDQVAPGSLLYYRLRQVDEDGSLHYSPVAIVSALEAAQAATQLVLYPNPATATVTVQLSGTAPAALVLLLNALGQVVLSRPALAAGQQEQLPLTDLAPGLYVVRCGALTQRLVIE